MFDNHFFGCMCVGRVFVVFTDSCGGSYHGHCQSEVTDHTGRDVSIPSVQVIGASSPPQCTLDLLNQNHVSKFSRQFICLRRTGLSHCFLLPHSVDSNETFGSSLLFCRPFNSYHAATYWKDYGWQGWQRQSMQSGFWSLDCLSGAQCKERSKCWGK